MGLLTFVVVLLFGSIAVGQTKQNTANIEREISEFMNRWNNAISTGDAATIRSSYVSDNRFNWFEDGKLTYNSREQIIDKLKSFPKGTKIETRLQDLRLTRMTDELVFGSAAFDTRIQMPTGSFSFAGVFTAIIEKDGGQWRFVSGHTSSLPAGDSSR